MVQPSVEKDIVVVAGKLGEMTIKVAVNPLELASQVSGIIVALQRAAEEAGICHEICKDIACTACNRAPILCDLLSVGALFPEDRQDLNEALQRCLSMALRHLHEALDVMYQYLHHGWMGQMRRAAETKDTLILTRQRMENRFNDIDSYVGYATNVQLRQGLQTVVPVVEAVEGLRRQLQALERISAGDSARVRAIAAAAVERCSKKGQKIDLGCRDLTRVAVSPDGEMFATTGRARVKVWEAATGKLLHQSPRGPYQASDRLDHICSSAWSPDGSFLATGTDVGLVELWKVSKSACERYKDDLCCWKPYCLAWSSDSTMLAAWGTLCCEMEEYVPVLKVWSVPSGEEVKPWGSAPPASAVAWSPAGTLMATLHWDNSVKLWSTATFELERETQLVRYSDYLNAHMNFSPDGRKLAFGSEGSLARAMLSRVLDVSTGAWEELKPPLEHIRDLAWNPNGFEIAIATPAGIFLYDAGTLSQKRVIYDSSKWRVQNIAWSPCSKLLYCALLRLDPHTSAIRVFRADVEQ